MDLLGLGSKGHIDFILDPQGQRKQIEVKLDDNNNKRSLQYTYYDGEDVGGSLIALPGELTENTSIDFHFPNVEKPYESYIGINVKLRYFLRLTIIRRFTNTIAERDICVQQLSQYPEINNKIENHEQRLLKQLNNECVRTSQEYPSHQEEFQQRSQQLSNN
ncbi:unnamed protein product [Rotaria magnacalcarata]|uniref:Uncharacterized protein n=1 Tax=Rotaria magnacalcarata TaxID=392030 RepID=A0A819ESV9_9BILA|nr:unnamed protein product [Rotaria magnacalcarata]CAF3854402.1 unnamed protein product [Rotaria magnacalcarata]CAF4205728.1 unnamed protein product [Rotaria magnacalcarata]CAF4381010.1 unnamed protein product [Rotaria magnacalcarata]